MIGSLVLGLFFAQAAALPVATADQIGAWTIERNKDPKTDTVITSAHVERDNLRIDYGCNAGPGTPTMLVITSRNFLGGVQGAAFGPVTFKTDGRFPVALHLRYGGNTVTTRYDETLRPAKAALVSGRSLTVKLVTQFGDPIGASFDITGGDRALAVVDMACGRMSAARR